MLFKLLQVATKCAGISTVYNLSSDCHVCHSNRRTKIFVSLFNLVLGCKRVFNGHSHTQGDFSSEYKTLPVSFT